MKWQENSLEIPFDTKCDIAFYPRLNVFNDTKSVQFEIVDFNNESIHQMILGTSPNLHLVI